MPEDRLLVESPEFWRKRLERAVEVEQEPHKAIWNTDRLRWNAMNEAHRVLLADLLKPEKGASIRLLDCGCGLGDLAGLIPSGVIYEGVDVSRDLLLVAKERFPALSRRFRVGNLRDLPYEDQAFDVAVARGVEGMVTKELGGTVWRSMEREILRVAGRLIVLSYDAPTIARVVEAVEPPTMLKSLVHNYGRLDYRIGQNMTAEIYDLLVDEEHRRRGLGRGLVRRLQQESFWCVYAFTRETNETALRFYEAMGFTSTRLPRFYPGMDGFMLKWINPAGIVPCNPLV